MFKLVIGTTAERDGHALIGNGFFNKRIRISGLVGDAEDDIDGEDLRTLAGDRGDIGGACKVFHIIGITLHKGVTILVNTKGVPLGPLF